MAVPTTPTATDKLEEVRNLNVEIAGLKTTEEIMRRAATGAEEAYQDAKKRADELTGKISELETQITETSKETKEFLTKCKNALQAGTASLEAMAQIAKDLSVKVTELCAEIEKRKTELANLQEAFATENANMSTKREDLNIYEERIRTAAEAVGIKVKL